EKLGVKRASMEDITGGTPEENARDIVDVLKGKKGAKRDIIAVNAGAALFVSANAENLAAGINLANRAIDSGAALNKLKELVNTAGEPGKLARFL
ncbi:MAG: anthranilate phosphoribosyltransferase, partial [Candidatus Methanoperedens sp.]|nr:anthranilate phosphoribosyltransferase [Candidatus Methanoperedens sp.]